MNFCHRNVWIQKYYIGMNTNRLNNSSSCKTTHEISWNVGLKPLDNIGKTNKKCSQIYSLLTWFKDNDGRKLSLKYLCLMCYRFRIISEIRSNNEFSSHETKFSHVGFILHISCKVWKHLKTLYQQCAMALNINFDSYKVWMHLQKFLLKVISALNTAKFVTFCNHCSLELL